MSWRWYRTLSTASDTGAVQAQDGKQGRWRPLGLRCRKLLGKGQAMRIFNPFAPSYRSNTPAQCYCRNELEKRRSYDERVREVEHGSFSPLVFSTTGGMGTAATVVYKRLASLVSEKQDKPYSRTMHWLRCRLSFSLLRSAIMCLRGSRSARHHPSSPPSAAIDLACAEGRVYSSHQ